MFKKLNGRRFIYTMFFLSLWNTIQLSQNYEFYFCCFYAIFNANRIEEDLYWVSLIGLADFFWAYFLQIYCTFIAENLHTSAYIRIQMYADIYRCMQIYIDVCKYIQMYAYTYRGMQIYTDVCIYKHLYAYVYRCIRMYTDVYRYIQMYTDIYRCIQIYTDVCICKHLYTSVYICIQIYADVYICIYLHTSISLEAYRQFMCSLCLWTTCRPTDLQSIF
jgi:hypothetical protein